MAVATHAIAAPGAHGPNGEHLDAPGAAPAASGLGRLADGSVNMPVLAQRRLGIRTVIATKAEAAATVQLSGFVVMDPNAGAYVQAGYAGRIRPGPNGFPVNGQSVTEGEVLASIEQLGEPYDAANQRALLAEIRSARDLAAKELKRVEALRGTVSVRQIDEARERLRSLNAREAEIKEGIGAVEDLRAPVSGVIARSDVVTGQVVDARDILFEIIDPARLRVEAVSADAALAGRIATATLQGIKGVKVEMLGAARTLRDGVLPVTFAAMPDPDAPPLAVGQPVTVLVQLSDTIEGFVLPAEAVVRNGANEPIVWIKSGAERFIPQPVRYRPLDAGTVVVTQGLSADNRVVVQGAPLIAQIR